MIGTNSIVAEKTHTQMSRESIAGAKSGRRPNVLAIAGSDSGGCAGIQVDLRVLAACGVHGLSAISAITAQNTRRVESIHNVPAAELAAQLDAVAADFRIAAAKIGMLGSAANVAAAAAFLRRHRVRNVVLDPVLVSSSGAPLLAARAVARLTTQLFPLVDVLTPNAPEAAALLGRPLRRAADLTHAARDLLGCGARWVLLKGGHLGGRTVRDVLVDSSGSVHEFSHSRLPYAARGTGCALASAIAAGLAHGMPVPEAVRAAERLLQAALRDSYAVGRGRRRALAFRPQAMDRAARDL